jgi:hypothetical protein
VDGLVSDLHQRRGETIFLELVADAAHVRPVVERRLPLKRPAG